MVIESGDFVYRTYLGILIYALTNVEALYSYCATHTFWVKRVVTPTPASLQSHFPLQNLLPLHLQSSPTTTLPPPPRILSSDFFYLSLQPRFPLNDLSPTQICPHYHGRSTPTSSSSTCRLALLAALYHLTTSSKNQENPSVSPGDNHLKLCLLIIGLSFIKFLNKDLFLIRLNA